MHGDGWDVPRNGNGGSRMKRFLKYLAVVLAVAAVGYLVYHYRQELLALAEQAKEKGEALKNRLCARRQEQNDFADL